MATRLASLSCTPASSRPTSGLSSRTDTRNAVDALADNFDEWALMDKTKKPKNASVVDRKNIIEIYNNYVQTRPFTSLLQLDIEEDDITSVTINCPIGSASNTCIVNFLRFYEEALPPFKRKNIKKDGIDMSIVYGFISRLVGGHSRTVSFRKSNGTYATPDYNMEIGLNFTKMSVGYYCGKDFYIVDCSSKTATARKRPERA